MVSMPGTRSTVGRSGPFAYSRCAHTRPPETREDGGGGGEHGFSAFSRELLFFRRLRLVRPLGSRVLHLGLPEGGSLPPDNAPARRSRPGCRAPRVREPPRVVSLTD